MSSLKVYKMDGEETGDIALDDSLLVNERGEQAVRDAVVAELAKRRRGTASTLTKGEVAGSNKKPWRQKGTGRARAGYRQSPLWRGGSVVFGPRPREFGGKVNRKAAQLAFKRALSDSIAGGQVKVLDSLELENGRTKGFVALLKSLDVSGPALFVVEGSNPNAERASRNIRDVEMARADSLSVYQLVRYPAIVATRGALEILKQRLGGAKPAPESRNEGVNGEETA